ncbi:MAG TPA: ATP-binding cassette domain-containing protein [Bryobacteraceae bacterium]|nr:ATP-binding cassette domain-containing protein [Bryobacteraceae bacterium]
MTHVRIAKKTATGLSLDVDFPVGPGVTGIVGPAGAGKSLLLETMAGFVTPDSGRFLLEDAILFDAAARVNAPSRRRGIGYIFPSLALFPHMTLERNVAFAAHDWPRLERHRRVTEMLDRFDLTAAAALRPGEARAAERLHCAVARALIGEPKLLLIDDAAIDEPLLALIREKFSNPILMATADLDLCSAAADELILLDAGRMVERGTARSVLDSPESVEAARLLGIPNLFQATIAALDPARKSSRLDFGAFALNGPHIPGHFRGDRVTVAVRPCDLRVHDGKASGENLVASLLRRVSERVRYVRIEFDGGIFAEIGRDEYARLKDNQEWKIEFPPESLRVL